MIGNDVVDLELAKEQSNWERKGFLEKVFTTSEQFLIRTAKDPHLQVWLLWSMKEAAYKAHQRALSLPRKINWREQQCEISSIDFTVASGVVKIGDATYLTQSTVSAEAVFSSAVFQKEIPLNTGLFKSSSIEMKTLFLKEISEAFMLNPEDLSLINNQDGIPLLLHKKQRLNTSFSFTDHGAFSAFSFPLTNC